MRTAEAPQGTVYQVQPITDPAVLRDFFNQNRALAAYALGDLEEPNWGLSDFRGAFAGETLAGVLLLWYGAKPPVCVLLFATPDAANALLGSPGTPGEVFGMVPADLLDVMRRIYTLGETRHLWRMAVVRHEFVAAPPRPRLRRLLGEDADAMTRLTALEAQPFERHHLVYTPALLEHGIFFGIEDERGQLVAAAGTHIIAPQERVGAVGHVFTAPHERGKGYATAVTGTVTQELFRQGIDLVALNVLQDNAPAIRAYQKLGYRIHGAIVDCVCTGRKSD
jgi:RimJ/RimL family protein N-acetyltransferase